jgi:putative Holliday junction resolvase
MEHKTGKTKYNTRVINCLGIDFGNKKIGLALAPQSLMALGFKILPNDKSFFEKMTKIIKEHEIGQIVVGIPLNMDGTKSEQTIRTERFSDELKTQFPQIAVKKYDERLSTMEAKKNLLGKLPRRRQSLWRRATEDAEAARIILQGYLDKRKSNYNIVP